MSIPIVLGAMAPTIFAMLIWGSIGIVVIAFGYILLSLRDFRGSE